MSSPRLHLLLNAGALADCLGQLAEGDHVVLLDRGVELLARDGATGALLEGAAAVAVSGVDCRARALPSPRGTQEVDDAGVVALIAAHAQVLSWG